MGSGSSALNIDEGVAAPGEGVDHSDDAWPRPAYAWYVLFVLFLAYTLSYADRMVMSLLIGPIKHDLGVSDTQVSLLIGFAFAFFYVLMGLPLGVLADRTNRRNMAAAGIVGWSAMTAACGVAGNFPTLFLARMGVGVGEATLSPCAYSMISDYFPRSRLGRAISVYTLGIPIGTGLAMLSGSMVIAALAGTPTVEVPLLGPLASWRAVFLCLSAPGVLVALLALSIREPIRRGAASGRTPQPNEALRFVRRNARTLICYLGGIGLVSAAAYGTMAWIPTFFIRTFGSAPSYVGFRYGLILAIGGVAGLVCGGALGDHLFRRGKADGHLRALIIGVVAAIPFFLALPFAPNADVALVLLIPATVAWSTSSGLAATVVQLMTPATLRGQMTALYFLVAGISGFAIGPTLVAVTTDFGFGAERHLNLSLFVIAFLLPLSALMLSLALEPYRSSIARQAAGEVQPGDNLLAGGHGGFPTPKPEGHS